MRWKCNGGSKSTKIIAIINVIAINFDWPYLTLVFKPIYVPNLLSVIIPTNSTALCNNTIEYKYLIRTANACWWHGLGMWCIMALQKNDTIGILIRYVVFYYVVCMIYGLNCVLRHTNDVIMSFWIDFIVLWYNMLIDNGINKNNMNKIGNNYENIIIGFEWELMECDHYSVCMIYIQLYCVKYLYF